MSPRDDVEPDPTPGEPAGAPGAFPPPVGDAERPSAVGADAAVPQGAGADVEGAPVESPTGEPAPSGWAPPGAGERPIPRGCNPLVFGVVMATIQFGATVWFMRSC